jgi:hypothetical protein
MPVEAGSWSVRLSALTAPFRSDCLHQGANMSTHLMSVEPFDLPGEVALALLERSMEFGHGALAVVRLAMAAKCGATLSERHWRFCLDVVASCRDPGLEDLMSGARHCGSAPCLTT